MFPFHDEPPLREDVDLAVQPHVHTAPGSVLRSFTVALAAVAAVDFDAAAADAAGRCAVLVRLQCAHSAPPLSASVHLGRPLRRRSATTSRLISLTLDLPAASFLVLARTASALPFDAHCLVPLPAPYGGCLVISPHLLFHINSQQHIDYTLSTNLFGDIDRQFHSEPSALVVDVQLSASVLLPISQQHSHMVQLVLALRDGQSMLLTVETAGSGVRGMNMRRLYSGSIASAMCVVARDSRYSWLYIGSRTGVSLLVELRERSDDEQLEQARVQQFEEDERDREREERETERKRLSESGRGRPFFRLSCSTTAKQRTVEDDEDGYDDIFGLSLSNTKDREAQRRLERARAKEETSRLYELTVRDAMQSISPCVDFVLLPPDAQPASEGQPRGLQTDVLAISGHGVQGTLSIQQDGVLPSLITRFALDQRCTGSWTVRAPERRKKSTKRKRDEMNDAAAPQYDTDLFIASQSDTTHLHVLEAITQVEAGASYLRADVRSLLVANVCGWLGVVQVWGDGVRLVWRGERTVDRTLAELRQEDEMDGEVEEQKKSPVSIVRARLCDPYIALGLSDGGLQLLRVDEVERKEERSDHPDPFTMTSVPITLQPLPSLPASMSAAPVTAFALYKHTSHDVLFDAESRQQARREDVNSVGVKLEKEAVVMEEETKAAPAAEEEEDVDDLDLLLAGGGDTKAAGSANGGVGPKQESVTDGLKREANDVSASARAHHVLVMCRLHYVELYALPSFVLLFRCRRFSAARQTLIDATDEQSANNVHAVLDDNLPIITDIAVHSFSEHASSLPVLLAHTSHIATCSSTRPTPISLTPSSSSHCSSASLASTTV